MPPTSGFFLEGGEDNWWREMKKDQHNSNYTRVWFITGSSDGLGRVLTEAVLARGERAVVTARTPERVRDLIERYPAQAVVVELDVTRHDQIRGAIAEATDRFGRIDVLVNNAGETFDSDVFGLFDVTRAVLPFMQRTGGGHIVNVLSEAPGRVAVEGFSAALAEEVAPLGIKVTTIEPGHRNGQRPGDSAAAAEAIIAAVDMQEKRPIEMKGEVKR
jgi:NAD(P)-dependent dehydrogenase (short-subunit alcohol dehydrogenase family)